MTKNDILELEKKQGCEIVSCLLCVHNNEKKIKGKCFPDENELQFNFCNYERSEK